MGESVKRLIGGKEEVKVLEGEVWEELGELEKEEERWKLEWEKVRRESEEVERKREEVVGGNEKLTAEWEAELGGLVGKLEKVSFLFSFFLSRCFFGRRLLRVRKVKRT